MTKIDIVSGFLGAGKTTLIKKLLAEAYKGEKLVLIENEFGEINIDGGFLKESGIQISEMSAGCICCSLVGDFNKALKDVEAQFHPDRILIEPSGVGKLSDVIVAVENTVKDVPDMKLNSFVTVADATKVKIYMKNFGEFFNNQIESAGTIVLSRTDVADADKVAKAVELIREKNPKAAVVTTPIGRLTGAQLLEIIEKPTDDMAAELLEEVRQGHHHHEDEGCCCGHDHDHEHHHHHHDHEECCCGHDHEHHHHHDHEEGECCCGHDHEHHHHHDHEEGECCCGHDHDHHHADEVFTSWGLETSRSVSLERLNEILHDLAHTEKYGTVLRAKGMLPDENGVWHYFDMVPEETEVREGAPIYTGKVCVIGSGLKEDDLKELFH